MQQIYPVIISAPHTCATLPKEWQHRTLLSPYELWQGSDPFTDKTSVFPWAFHVHHATNHRFLGDLNRPATLDSAFQTQDFYKRPIWKPGMEPTVPEMEALLATHWKTYHAAIDADIHRLIQQGVQKILFIDHHNTAADHPLNSDHGYIPSLVISNLGDIDTGTSQHMVSAQADIMQHFAKELQTHVGLPCEMNRIFHGGFNTKWVAEHNEYHQNVHICALQLEYNLGLIHNPLSKTDDQVAMEILTMGIQKAQLGLIDYMGLEPL